MAAFNKSKLVWKIDVGQYNVQSSGGVFISGHGLKVRQFVLLQYTEMT